MRTPALVALLCLTAPAPAQDQRSLHKAMAAARAKVFPALVHILSVEESFSRGETTKSVSSGSGFIIDKLGHVVTNHHVAGGKARRLYVTLATKRKVRAELVASDPYTDLAVLRVDPKQAFPGAALPVATFGDSSKLREGDFVMAMGSPLSLSRSISFGIVSCRDRMLGAMRVGGRETGKYNTWLQTDAAINPGNSGGPLVNLAGEVIGVNTRASLMANNIGFAIPADIAKEVVAALLKHKRVVRSFLGLKLQPLDAIEDTLLAAGKGVLVAAIASRSPAERAQLLPGDIITHMNGTPFSAQFEEQLPTLYRRISKLPLGQVARIRLVRRSEQIELKLSPVPLGRQLGTEREIKAWGITVRAITKQMRRERQLPDMLGVLVTGVRAGSPASGRLDREDIIRTLQGVEVTGLATFLRLTEESVKRKDKLVRMILRRSTVTDVTALKPTYRRGR